MADDKKKKGGLDAFLDWLLHPPEKKSKLNWWVTYLSGWGISRGLLLTVAFFSVHAAARELLPVYENLVAGWLLLALPLFLTVGLGMTFWGFWLWYVQTNFIFLKTDPVLLEVRMPTDVTKSPRAMEQVLTTLWISGGETTYVDRYWKGGTRPYFSLEIVSFGGEIRFFIWCRRVHKNIFEAAMYAQYPEVEIIESEDYAQRFEYNPATTFMFWNQYELASDDVFPIKTYIDFELDEDPKEEFKVDPLAQVIETLGTMQAGEQGWLQIVCRYESPKNWVAKVKEAVDKIRAEMSLKTNGEGGSFPRPRWSQNEQMRNMERNMGKLVFTVGIRSCYIAPANNMRPTMLSNTRTLFRPFNNPGYLNSLNPTRGSNPFDYPWQDYKNTRLHLTWRRHVDAYRRRQFWSPPWKLPVMHMTTEVIATLWHPPSRTIQTPGILRIPTAKAEPPANLPL